jgi:hypothetical protein
VLNLQTNNLHFLPGPFDNLVGLRDLCLSSNFLEVSGSFINVWVWLILAYLCAVAQGFPHELYGFSALTALDLGHNRCAHMMVNYICQDLIAC